VGSLRGFIDSRNLPDGTDIPRVARVWRLSRPRPRLRPVSRPGPFSRVRRRHLGADPQQPDRSVVVEAAEEI
jgi:hypothetical protein